MVRCEAAGQVNMKSFLMGSPDIKIGLNEDLTIGKEERRRGTILVSLFECYNSGGNITRNSKH